MEEHRWTYQTATNKHYSDGDMLEVCSAPLASPTTQVLEEDVGRAIEEDEEAFDELG